MHISKIIRAKWYIMDYNIVDLTLAQRALAFELFALATATPLAVSSVWCVRSQ